MTTAVGMTGDTAATSAALRVEYERRRGTFELGLRCLRSEFPGLERPLRELGEAVEDMLYMANQLAQRSQGQLITAVLSGAVRVDPDGVIVVPEGIDGLNRSSAGG